MLDAYEKLQDIGKGKASDILQSLKLKIQVASDM